MVYNIHTLAQIGHSRTLCYRNESNYPEREGGGGGGGVFEQLVELFG